MKLFIVESPTKARTIQRYLGKDFKVKATLGHIKDLPPKGLGVDEESLRAQYVYLKGKKKVVQEIKRAAKRADRIYIGTDPDREGEAIAYFLKQELSKVSPAEVKRARFYEITKEAIKNSLEEASEIDMNLVHSQFARRILDRLIGYKLSPKLWKALKDFKLSAGRVQSPTLRLIVDREIEIQNFKEKKYYYVKAEALKEGKSFILTYDYRYEKPSDAKDIAKRIENGVFSVLSIQSRREKLQAPKPFTTSSLQAEANAKLGLSVEKTQKLAQTLYEMGLITYPRTDSLRMNRKVAKKFMEYITTAFGGEYSGKLRKFKEKPISQGAHECIRPTGVKPDPPIDGELLSLYRLIFNRTIASLMAPAEIERTEVKVLVEAPKLKRPIEMIAKGTTLSFDGWCRTYPCSLEEKHIPPLDIGEVLSIDRVYVEQRKTTPPPRYTEGSLVKTLEKLGIGRPSTYATLIKTLKGRGYIKNHKGKLIPTEKAFAVVEFLKLNFPLLMDYSFTAKMEGKLDMVEKGKMNWKSVVKESFENILEG
jgi:DNA topoisomerase-1